ncbi:flippase [Mucilaginibacter sp.]|uniref:flippase n=1 Tax=Mucilaginibacter sp. TaxID=1882438 RepID=UPI003D0FB0DD
MIKKNLIYNALLSVSQFIFPLITFPYSSRILGPNGIGSINFIDSFTQYFILFAALGIPLYGVREISKHKSDQKALEKSFNEIFLIHIISAFVFSIIYLIIGFLIPNLRAHFDLVLVGITMVIFGVLSAEWLFQGMEKFAYITSRTLVVRIISVALLFIFLKKNSPPVVYYGVLASGVVVNGFINIFYLKRIIKINFSEVALKNHLKPLFIILGSTLAVSVYLLMDSVILGFLQSEKAVGIYATALRIVRLPLALIGAVNSVIIPRVARAYDQSNYQEINSYAQKSFGIICVLVFPIVVGIYISSPFLIHTFAGNKFNESIIPLQILAPLILIIGFANIVCVQLLAPMEQEKALLKIYFASMIFSLVINIFMIKYYSYLGASIGMILTETFATVVAYFYLKKIIDIVFDKRLLMLCSFGSLIFFPIAFIVRSLISNDLIKEITVIFCCILFYSSFILLFVKNAFITNLKKMFFSKLST